MSSLYTDSQGRRVLQFAGATARHTMRLGKIGLTAANKIKAAVDQCEDELALLGGLSAESLAWLQSARLELRNRFVSAGLIPRFQAATTLAVLLARFEKELSVKESTMIFYRQTIKNLTDCYGGDTMVTDIKNGLQFRQHLAALSNATKSRRVIAARTIWNFAQKNGYVSHNPFSEVEAGDQSNIDRHHHLSKWDAQYVLSFMRTDQLGLRTVFALARYGGLRCPSEIKLLRWEDVDWDSNRMIVRSPKTEHHKGGDRRVIPIFTDLRDHLRAAFDARDDSGLVIGADMVATAGNAWTSKLLKVLNRASVKPWPRLWQNLRSSCETDLLDAGFADHVVGRWLGHSVSVQRKHYAQVHDEHFERAANRDAVPGRLEAFGGKVIAVSSEKTQIQGVAGAGFDSLTAQSHPYKHCANRACAAIHDVIELADAYNRVMRRYARRTGGAK